jgi:hypothetical protein
MMDVVFLPLGQALAAARRLHEGGGEALAAPPPARPHAPVDVVAVDQHGPPAPALPAVAVTPVAHVPPGSVQALSAREAYEANLQIVQVAQLDMATLLKVVA